MAKNNDSLNFDSVIKNLSPDTKVSEKPWFKKKVSIIAMSSTLGAGVLATVIAVPVALTSGTSSNETTPPTPTPPTPPKKSTPEEIAAAIAAFNALGVTQKIDGYNKFVNDNSGVILTYFQGVGMGKFYDANVHTPISTTDAPNTTSAPTNFQKLRTRISTSAFLSNGTDKGGFTIPSGFLRIKGVLNNQDDAAAGPGLGNTNFGSASFYCNVVDALPTSDPNFMYYLFLSPIVASISNVTLSSDYTINMTLTDQAKNISFYLQTHNGGVQKSLYKTNLTYNNETLFPNMSTSFATQVLKLVL